ncbi:MAG: hypothetical protein FGM32_04845 [Candidatus Kapabacteria bacterium]|nr:hypothetical protein [Candidatus Kapabacteria bacterium]
MSWVMMVVLDTTMTRRILSLAFFAITMQMFLQAAEQFQFRRISLDQGLPQMDVHSITQSTDGFIWLGTQDGLCRYDGQRLDVYRGAGMGNGQLVSSHIRYLTRGSRGDVDLVSGNTWMRYRAASDDFVQIPKPPNVSVNDPSDSYYTPHQITVRFTDSHGRRWNGTRSSGAYMHDPETGRNLHFAMNAPSSARLLSNEIWSIAEDALGRVWLGTYGGGVSIIDGDKVIQTLLYDADDPKSIAGNIIRSIYRDDAGVMWVGTFGGGVCSWDPSGSLFQTFRLKHHTNLYEDEYVRAFAVDSKDQLYVSTRAGIVVMDKDRRQQRTLLSLATTSTSLDLVRALYVDRFDNVWFGTERRGVGIIRAGTSRVTWLNGPQWRPDIRCSNVFSITEVGTDTLIIGTGYSIAIVHPTKREPVWYRGPVADRPKSILKAVTSIFTIAETGELLISSELGLLRGSLKRGFSFIKCPDTNAIRPNIDVMRAANRRGDTLYVGTWGGGIRIFHLPSWRETVVDSRHGLPSNTIYAAIPLDDGGWIASSNAGIIYWRNLNAFISYGVDQGAQSNEFNTGAFMKLRDGTILLGGVSGFNVIPKKFTSMDVPPPKNYIHSITMNGAPISIRGWRPEHGVMSGPGPKNITISFSSIATSRPSSVSYRVRLLPVDTNWSYVQSPTVTYLQMPSGQYTVEIESAFRGGSWGARLSMPIDIETVIWETRWFFVASMLLIVSVPIAASRVLNRLRQRRTMEREDLLRQERERIARDLHDDVGAGLTRIVVIADSLGSKDAIERGDVSRISEMARTAIESVRSIVWVVKSTDTSLKNTVYFIRDKMGEMLADRGVDFVFQGPREWPEVSLSIIARRNIVLSCQEVATNILRHSHATSVVYSVATSGTRVSIIIEDNGLGISFDGLSYSNGLDNIRVRTRELDGTCEIVRLESGGTRVSFHFNLQFGG